MFWRKAKMSFARLSTRTLVVIPFMLSFIPIAILLSLPGYRYTGTPIQDQLISSILFLWGCTGIPIIVRGESPGSVPVRGWLAYIQGFLMISIPWGIAISRMITK
jgi:small-conductance mechanosensitive channel